MFFLICEILAVCWSGAQSLFGATCRRHTGGTHRLEPSRSPTATLSVFELRLSSDFYCCDRPALTCTATRQVLNCLLLLTFRIASTGLKHRLGVCLSVRQFKLQVVAGRHLRRRGQRIFRPFCPMVDTLVTPATVPLLSPRTHARTEGRTG